MSGFRNILIAFFLSELGRAMYFVTITWLLYQTTNDASYTGILIGLGFLPGLILNLFFGVIVDRYNRKTLSVLANALSTFSMAILLLFFLNEWISPWLIIGVHMILQMSGSLFRPAIQAFISECFKNEYLPKIYSQSSSVAIIGGLLGASVGGLLLSFIPVWSSMSIVTVSFAIASIALMLMKNFEKGKQEIEKKNSIVMDIADGFIYMKNNKLLLGLFIIMFNGQLVFHTSLGFLSVYTVDYLLQSPSIYGLMDATISVGGVLGGLLGTWWWSIGKNKIAIYSLFVVLLGLFFVGMSTDLLVSFFGVFLLGLGTTWIRVLLQSVQQMFTDPEYHGRMASYRMIGNQASVVISAPLFGWIASNFGANYIYLSLMVPIGLCIVFAAFQSKQDEFIKITEKVA